MAPSPGWGRGADVGVLVGPTSPGSHHGGAHETASRARCPHCHCSWTHVQSPRRSGSTSSLCVCVCKWVYVHVCVRRSSPPPPATEVRVDWTRPGITLHTSVGYCSGHGSRPTHASSTSVSPTGSPPRRRPPLSTQSCVDGRGYHTTVSDCPPDATGGAPTVPGRDS